jgi:8-oxo-dGTP diphosphatase
MSQEFRDKFTFRAAAFLVLKQEGKILLSLRKNTKHEDGKYGFVAGHLDGNETAQQAIAREAKEEANIDIDPEDLEVRHVSHHKSSDGMEYFQIYLIPKRWGGDIQDLEPEKCGDLSWFPIAEMPGNTIDYIREVIGHIEMGQFYSNFGW